MNAVYDVRRVRQDFGRAAEAYDAHADLQRDVLRQAAALLLPHLNPGDALLDAGCGTGRAQEFLIPIGGIYSIGVDIALPMCKNAAKRGMRAVCADISALPMAAECVDAVFCSLALQWVERRTAMFSECFRVTRTGGHAAFAAFGEGTLGELDAVFRQTGGGARVSRFPALPLLMAEAQAAGWRCVHHSTAGHVRHYASLNALMHSLKSIGAVNKRTDRPRGLTTAATFRRAETLYRTLFGQGETIRATWTVHYLLLEKP